MYNLIVNFFLKWTKSINHMSKVYPTIKLLLAILQHIQ